MVSTRGIKFKFTEGEKVLCYEPDPTKAKVLYDSKVLEIIVNKDQRGRKAIEYLIHFQGWNSSWDRCVPEEYVLKDTEENRQLQRDLAEKSQLQLGAYLYRKERKKRSHNRSDRSIESGSEIKRSAKGRGSGATSATTGSSEDGSSEQQEDYDTEDIVSEEESGSSSEEMETSEEDLGNSQDGNSSPVDIEIEFGPILKQILEHDYDLIVHKKKIIMLPMQPNVYDILESWVHHYTITELTSIMDKPQRSKGQNSTLDKNSLDKIVSDICVCRQAADGLRIYFDVYLGGLLLYVQEKEQFLNFTMKSINIDSNNQSSNSKEDAGESDITIKEEMDESEFAHLPPFQEQEADTEKVGTKRVLRSSRISSGEEVKQNRTMEESKPEPSNLSSMNSLASTSSRSSSPRGVTLRTSVPIVNSVLINGIIEKCKQWRLMPEDAKKDAYAQSKPSIIYGAPHLLRLIVKIPDIFLKTNIRGPKLKALLKKIDSLLSYMREHKEWFDDQYYVQKTNSSTEQSVNT